MLLQAAAQRAQYLFLIGTAEQQNLTGGGRDSGACGTADVALHRPYLVERAQFQARRHAGFDSMVTRALRAAARKRALQPLAMAVDEGLDLVASTTSCAAASPLCGGHASRTPSGGRARLGPCRRLGLQGIVRPIVLRITPLKILFYDVITALPESREILRDQHRPARGRQQMQQHRRLAAGEPRRIARAEHLLQPHRARRCIVAVIARPPRTAPASSAATRDGSPDSGAWSAK